MAVRIRLARHGTHKRPFYRIVATDSRTGREGRFLELLGTYNSLGAEESVTLKADRVRYWLGVGALPSDTVRSLIKRHMPKDAGAAPSA